MDLRSQTSLVGAVVCLAITASVVLRPRKRRVHWLFSGFAATVSAWFATTLLQRLTGAGFWERLNLVVAILLPLTGVQFFRAFLARGTSGSSRLIRAAIVFAIGLSVLAFTPFHRSRVVGTGIFLYVLVLLGTVLLLLRDAARRARSRVDAARLTYLAFVGTFAAIFTLAEYLPYVGFDVPPVGTVLIMVFLFALSQSIGRYRLLDLYELAGRLTVLTALSFSLAGILFGLVALDPGNFYLHSVAAALALLLVYDPLRAWVEDRISQLFVRERREFERTARDLRRRLANVLSVEALADAVVRAFESSRRVTHAALYILDEGELRYALRAHVGPLPRTAVELALAQRLVERVGKDGALVLETLERDLEERTELGDVHEVETIRELIEALDALGASVCVPIRSEQQMYGLLCVRDERLRDAFSPEEIGLLASLGAQAAIAIENSRLHARLRERDRLAALGEMAAGLAHEIRNPLGAIKATAQFLAEPTEDTNREFLDIIVEEVDRLNRVVSSFLDYARPSTSATEPIDVTPTIERTLQMVSSELGSSITVVTELATALPSVRIDTERLRQVLLNLLLNAAQAMDGRGRLTVRTLLRERRTPGSSDRRRFVEIEVIDTGPGLAPRIAANLFVPFVTTKDRGTGLGLAISQRIVTAAGGTIEAWSAAGQGTTFVIRLPADDPSSAISSDDVARESDPGERASSLATAR